MILHTIVDPELIWRQGPAEKATTEIEYQGIRLEVVRFDEKTVQINRIISTDLKNYLDPGLQPGAKMEYTLKSQE